VAALKTQRSHVGNAWVGRKRRVSRWCGRPDCTILFPNTAFITMRVVTAQGLQQSAAEGKHTYLDIPATMHPSSRKRLIPAAETSISFVDKGI
ncbi:hypothetical protein, partial [Ensifer sp. ZNC0028]|uniref:hypothetical protein n=1 Tax=Ensifer sp. ZNC0028 TaxID=1339236 RepID=UPI001AEC5BB0